MSRPKTLIYAELLSNIRQISIIAALEVPCDSSTQVELSQDGHQFLLHHDGNVHTLNLPGCALMDFRLQSPALGSKELSWRLPLAGEPRIPSAESSDAPWPAKDLKESSEFRCRSCGEVVVGKGAVRVWKDLPSENWAEMMDFWHCHKPSVHEPNCSTDSGHRSHDKAHGSDRGYGANTKFTAQPRTGFVDMTTLLLAKPDCRGIETEASLLDESFQYQPLVCKSCQKYLGHVDQHAEGFRLYKWRLKTTIGPCLGGALSYYQPSTASIITAQLQSIMLAQCSSRLLLLPISWKSTSQHLANPIPKEISASAVEAELPPSSVLSLWVLNPVLRYSATNVITQSPSSCSSQSSSGVLAMKVFWRCIDNLTASGLVESDSIEEVTLPMGAILEIEANLRSSAKFLPPSGRKFQDWDVGLLERFEDEAV